MQFGIKVVCATSAFPEKRKEHSPEKRKEHSPENGKEDSAEEGKEYP